LLKNVVIINIGEGVEMKISFLKKMPGSHKAALLGILVVALVHSAGQLYFIQDEKLRLAELAQKVNPPQELKVESEQAQPQVDEALPQEFEAQKVEAVREAKPVLRRSAETLQQPERKKAVRETREARLRRAERILTGV
jgi:apolipoprotein N-acyltransferase